MTSPFEREDGAGGTNIHNNKPCPTCDGHRLILVSDDKGFDVYARCAACNPAPTSAREPVGERPVEVL